MSVISDLFLLNPFQTSLALGFTGSPSTPPAPSPSNTTSSTTSGLSSPSTPTSTSLYPNSSRNPPPSHLTIPIPN